MKMTVIKLFLFCFLIRTSISFEFGILEQNSFENMTIDHQNTPMNDWKSFMKGYFRVKEELRKELTATNFEYKFFNNQNKLRNARKKRSTFHTPMNLIQFFSFTIFAARCYPIEKVKEIEKIVNAFEKKKVHGYQYNAFISALTNMKKSITTCLGGFNLINESFVNMFKKYNREKVDNKKLSSNMSALDTINIWEMFSFIKKQFYLFTVELNYMIKLLESIKNNDDLTKYMVSFEILKEIQLLSDLFTFKVNIDKKMKELQKKIDPHRNQINKIDQYTKQIVLMDGFKEYTKINPQLLTAKNNILTWIGNVKPSMHSTLQHIMHLYLDIESLSATASEQCIDEQIIAKLGKYHDINSILKQLIAWNQSFNDVTTTFKAKLLVMKLKTTFRKQESQKVEEELKGFNKIINLDFKNFQDANEDIKKFTPKVKNEINKISKEIEILKNKIMVVEDKYNKAIKKRDAIQTANISVGVVGGILAFFTFFIPVVGSIISAVITGATLATNVGLTIGVGEYNKKLVKLEGELELKEIEMNSLLLRFKATYVDVDKIKQYTNELNKLQNMIGDSRVPLTVLGSYYSRLSTYLYKLIDGLKDVKNGSGRQKFCYVGVNIEELGESYNELFKYMSEGKRNPRSIQLDQDIFTHRKYSYNLNNIANSQEYHKEIYKGPINTHDGIANSNKELFQNPKISHDGLKNSIENKNIALNTSFHMTKDYFSVNKSVMNSGMPNSIRHNLKESKFDDYFNSEDDLLKDFIENEILYGNNKDNFLNELKREIINLDLDEQKFVSSKLNQLID